MTADEGRRRSRRLSSEDRALWDGVTRSVRPLRKRATEAAPVAAPQIDAKAAKKAAPTPAVQPAATVPQRKTPPLAPLDRKTKQKIARGRETIDGRLDLHGHSQAEAHDALLRFLRRTQGRGGRLVLVITGKGKSDVSGRGDGGGVLKRAVPLWLALPEFRALVIGYDAASPAHGGEGALYVRLRKMRDA
ncbi:Smr/MutS family protein [Pseudorhodoplanes sp.]|uniref:Smr/MutS family protein n=1 Tax=Pseudorhodoplanes sp. TaxID=1934341 RepID=UPI00391B1CC3